MDNNIIELQTRFNIIYYTNELDMIKSLPVYQFEKLKIKDAKELLNSKGIVYNRFIKVVLEEKEYSIPKNVLEKYAVKK